MQSHYTPHSTKMFPDIILHKIFYTVHVFQFLWIWIESFVINITDKPNEPTHYLSIILYPQGKNPISKFYNTCIKNISVQTIQICFNFKSSLCLQKLTLLLKKLCPLNYVH